MTKMVLPASASLTFDRSHCSSVPRRNRAATASQQLRGHLGNRRRRVDLEWVRFHNLRHFAATMLASTCQHQGDHESWRLEVGRHGGALRTRTEERDAFLAQALNAFTTGDNVVSFTHELSGDSARGAGATDASRADRARTLTFLKLPR